MPHINIPEGLPGIRGLFAVRPDTARVLNQFVDTLLRGESPLTRGERELIATYVSSLNDCFYCQTTHGAVAAVHLGSEKVVEQVKKSPSTAPVGDKMQALLHIAGLVQKGGKAVTQEAVDAARKVGATDIHIHDTVLIAAAFCMFNRYVDGLGTTAPTDPDLYRKRAVQVAEQGYYTANKELMKG